MSPDPPPAFAPAEDRMLPARALRWLAEGRRVAVATVLETWGSSPRPVGSQLVVDELRRFVGSVSGGCVEGAVLDAALQTMEDGRVRVPEFGVSDDEAWDVGLACGGRVRILVRREEPGAAVLPALAAAVEAAEPAVVAMRVDGPERALVLPLGDADPVTEGLEPSPELRAVAREAVRRDRSGLHEVGGEAVFLQVHNTPLRLVLVGAVHIAQPLARMATEAGWTVVVVDPRAAFATEDRFPGVRLVRAWPEEAMESIRPDARTAVVTLTHDPKLDDPALRAALASDAFYVGALGSRRTHRRRLERLEGAGVDERDTGRVHGPVGLPIGALTPAEIAVSILAQVVAVLRAEERGQGGGAPAP